MREVTYKDEITPVKLSIKDRRIFRELDRNARSPISIIARKVGLSKEVVNYRIKRLLDIRFITGFNTILNINKIGWNMFHVFIKLKSIDSNKENKILDFFIKHPNVSCVKKCLGNYDIVLKIFAKDLIELDSIMKEIGKRYENSIDNYITDFIVQESAVPFSLLYGEADIQKLEPKSEKTAELNHLEARILKELSNNARMSLADLSSKLKAPRDTIKYHIKKLEKNNIVSKYRPSIWPERTGYNYFLVTLKTEKISEEIEKGFELFLLNYPNVTYFYRTIGNNDIQIEIRAKTTEKLNEIILKIREILGDNLKHYEALMVLKEPKFTYAPECIIERIN